MPYPFGVLRFHCQHSAEQFNYINRIFSFNIPNVHNQATNKLKFDFTTPVYIDSHV